MLTLDPDSNRQFIIIRNHQDIAVCTTELNEHGQLISQTTAEFDTPPVTQEDGFADYRDTGNGLQLLCYTHSYRINAQTARCDWFDAQGELAVGNRRVVYTFSMADSFCFCLNDS